jgi:hypothetical protein
LREENNNNNATSYVAPELPQNQINPAIVRDELLKCFESANREFVNITNQPATEEQIKQQTRQFLTTAFQSCGVSFENPSKEGIITAIEQCKRNAETMMGQNAREIIAHHYNEMMKLVSKL